MYQETPPRILQAPAGRVIERLFAIIDAAAAEAELRHAVSGRSDVTGLSPG